MLYPFPGYLIWVMICFIKYDSANRIKCFYNNPTLIFYTSAMKFLYISKHLLLSVSAFFWAWSFSIRRSSFIQTGWYDYWPFYITIDIIYMRLFIRPLLYFTLIQYRRYDNFHFFKAAVSITTGFQFESYSIPKTNIPFLR